MLPSAAEARTNGPDRDPFLDRDLVIGQAVQLEQHERDAAALVELLQRAPQPRGLLFVRRCLIVGLVVCRVAADQGLVLGPACQLVPLPIGAYVACNHVQPRGQAGSPVELGDGAEGAQEGFLRDVVGVLPGSR